jgi:hypothetical protein
MADLKGQPGELRMTLQIKRAATGKVETYEMVGHSDPEKLKEILQAQAKTEEGKE